MPSFEAFVPLTAPFEFSGPLFGICEALQARRVFARHPQPLTRKPRAAISVPVFPLGCILNFSPSVMLDAIGFIRAYPYLLRICVRVPPQAERVFAHLAEKSDSQGDIRKAVYLQDLQNRRVPMQSPTHASPLSVCGILCCRMNEAAS